MKVPWNAVYITKVSTYGEVIRIPAAALDEYRKHAEQPPPVAAPVYACGRCKVATARYRAENDIPRHGWLWTMCREEDINRQHYRRIEP